MTSQRMRYGVEPWSVLAPDVGRSVQVIGRTHHVIIDCPDPAVPQQLHLDVMVDDLAVATERVLAIGARRLSGPDGDAFVFADPAGHPFCLIPRPAWAPPVGA